MTWSIQEFLLRLGPKPYSVVAKWLVALPKPVEVMACNDMRALQVMAAAQEARMLVPEEVAILGSNNDAIRCELSYPPLSSVATDPFQSGHVAAETMDRLLWGLPVENGYVRVDPRGVVARHSTDVLAIDERNVAAGLMVRNEDAPPSASIALRYGHEAGRLRSQSVHLS
ncbi:MAG TPA: substrate-binding domain-containing protein [Candidatus Synoicihabitans sp.]|nr:substrate-binding domain-containing protein [Candidatus Synoicihabitans sp.]